MTMTSSFLAHTPKVKCPSLEVSDYHLIFDLNGVLVAIGEGQTRTCPLVLRLGLKEFVSTCVKTFMVYIWSSTLKRNFSRHLEIIVEKTSVCLLSFRIVDQSLYFENDHFLPEKSEKPIFHKNLFNFFVQLPSMMFENTSLIDDMPHKSLFNPPFSAIFFETFYKSHNDVNYLLKTVLTYLEYLHSFRMWVYKFVELNILVVLQMCFLMTFGVQN
jgi:hypothetical protein